jgi:hypothetical protein
MIGHLKPFFDEIVMKWNLEKRDKMSLERDELMLRVAPISLCRCLKCSSYQRAGFSKCVECGSSDLLKLERRISSRKDAHSPIISDKGNGGGMRETVVSYRK